MNKSSARGSFQPPGPLCAASASASQLGAPLWHQSVRLPPTPPTCRWSAWWSRLYWEEAASNVGVCSAGISAHASCRLPSLGAKTRLSPRWVTYDWIAERIVGPWIDAHVPAASSV